MQITFNKNNCDCTGSPINIGDLVIVTRTVPLVAIVKKYSSSGNLIYIGFNGWRCIVRKDLTHQLLKVENLNKMIKEYYESKI